jgi:GcrA cell cycle regulator
VQYRTHGNAALKPVFVPVEKPAVELRIVPTVVPDVSLPAALQVVLLDLKENMCRWPIGDPQDETFHFCGHAKAPGISYCEHHATKAFQPAARRRK